MHKKVVPDIDFSFLFNPKKPSVDIWVLKMHFPKKYIFAAQIEAEGPGVVFSLFVKSPSFARVPCSVFLEDISLCT